MANCISCGAENIEGASFCANCGTALAGSAAINQPPQQEQGYQVPPNYQYQNPYQNQPPYTQNQPYNMPGVPAGYQQKSKLVAGLLNIFLGSFGIGRFYLGYNSIAVLQLVVTIVTCGAGSLWGLIDGILILTGKPNVDANGVPLKD